MNIPVSWIDLNNKIRRGTLIAIVHSIETLAPTAVIVGLHDHKFYYMRVDELTYCGE